MNKKWKKLMALFAISLTVFPLGTSVIADDGHDHDDDDDEKHEYYQKSSDDDVWDLPQNQLTYPKPPEYWNIWSRETRNNPDNPLPIAEPEELTVILDKNESSVYFIPQEGQLLVSVEVIAEVLGAQVQVFPLSKIAVLTKDNLELIIKAGSNAVFENRVKTPMPIQAASYEKSVYLPVSVAANTLGYRVLWDSNKKAIVFQSI
ncbi:copper amine oxidase N-terminal domain-containing protein [Neobacillus soli]|uniref:copper amine oxidase N-terminal domain-containing protein n=1 Tax=Neobacillus soli TaxID=220688 RepID=UPI00082444D0|nr:copper amine oxidase N-terminal domain-containing protein [Neobacillus soli]